MARQELSPLERAVRSRVVSALQSRVAPRFQDRTKRGWHSAAARALGCNPSTLSRLLQKDSTVVPDLDFVEKLATYLGDSPDEFLAAAPRTKATPRLRDLPGYKASMDTAKRIAEQQARSVEKWAWERAGDFRAPNLSTVTADLLLALVATYMSDSDLREQHGD